MARLHNIGKRTINGHQTVGDEKVPFAFEPNAVLDFDDAEIVEKLLALYPLEVKDLNVAASAAESVKSAATGKLAKESIADITIPKK
jgi:hypothetical protein